MLSYLTEWLVGDNQVIKQILARKVEGDRKLERVERP